ncbi:MAG: hypothetical protein EOO63_17935 [Hymenobacter sp.]|nr:MAG: hypothetical protein EOO63_17935 [Hymenobacter sp.]
MKMPVFCLVAPAYTAMLLQVAGQHPYLKAAKKADAVLKQQVGELLGKHGAHTTLYAVKKRLLQKLMVEARGKVFVIESFSPETGQFYGTMWSGIDSLSCSSLTWP